MNMRGGGAEQQAEVGRDERGGVAIVFLLAFMALAVPVSAASVQFAGQLSINSRAFDSRLGGGDSARAGIELALWHLRNDEEPPTELSLEINGGTTHVTIDEGTTTHDLSDFAYADFVLTLDVSGSINHSELDDLILAADTIVDAFELDETDGRIVIGLTKFADSSASMVPMTVDAEALHYAIGQLDDIRVCEFSWGGTCFLWGDPDVGSGTDIVDALDGGAAQYPTGLGDRPDIPNLLVVITDGNDSAGNSDAAIAAASAATSAEVFAVGVGGVDEDTLEAMATDPDYGDGYEDGCDFSETLGHVFYVDDFDDLLGLIDCIIQAVNQAALIGTLYDIESVAPDGSMIRVRCLLTPEGETIILSWQEY